IAITAHAARRPARAPALLFDPSVMKNLPGFASIYSRFCAPSCSSQEVTRLVAHARSRTSQRQISGLSNQPPLAAMSAILVAVERCLQEKFDRPIAWEW